MRQGVYKLLMGHPVWSLTLYIVTANNYIMTLMIIIVLTPHMSGVFNQQLRTLDNLGIIIITTVFGFLQTQTKLHNIHIFGCHQSQKNIR